MPKSQFVSRILRTLLVLVTLSVPELAQAQSVHMERDQHVVFDDELLNADLGTPSGALVFGAHVRPPRPQLIRPRTNFVPELYKSIENI